MGKKCDFIRGKGSDDFSNMHWQAPGKHFQSIHFICSVLEDAISALVTLPTSCIHSSGTKVLGPCVSLQPNC